MQRARDPLLTPQRDGRIDARRESLRWGRLLQFVVCHKPQDLTLAVPLDDRLHDS